jgi:hypothetical protein
MLLGRQEHRHFRDAQVKMGNRMLANDRVLDWAARNSDELRTGTDPRWVELRRVLTEERLDPGETAVGDLHPDDGGEVAVVLGVNGRVLEISLHPDAGLGAEAHPMVVDVRELVAEADLFPHSLALWAAARILRDQGGALDPLSMLELRSRFMTASLEQRSDHVVSVLSKRASGEPWTVVDLWEESSAEGHSVRGVLARRAGSKVVTERFALAPESSEGAAGWAVIDPTRASVLLSDAVAAAERLLR